MSDRIETIIAAHRPYGLDCKCGRPINSDNDWASHMRDVLKADRVALVELPEPDDADIELVLDAVEEALHQVGAVVCVAEGDDDPGTPGIATSDGGAVCLYDLNNDICSTFLGLVRAKPHLGRVLAAEILSAAGTADASR